MADGTSFEISIPVKAEGVGAAASAVEQLETRLKAAGLASAAAAEAVKAGAAAYSAAETAANRTAAAAERIGLAVAAQEGKLAKAMETGDPGKIEAATQKLLDLGARQDEAKTKAEAAASALANQAIILDNLRASAAEAAETEAGLAESIREEADAQKAAGIAAQEAAKFREQVAASLEESNAALAAETEALENVGGKAGGGSIKLNEMAESLGKMGGPAGIAGQKLAGLGNAFQKMAAMGPAALFIAVGVALVAVVAGIAAAAIGLLKFGFASADAARTSMLLTAGIAGSVEGGKALEKTIGDLGNKVPMTTEELRNMASGLAKSGLKGAELSSALEEAAIKSAKLKFGPEYEKAMLGADFQSKKLKDNLGKVFGGLKTDGVMAALQKVVGLFDENSSSAKAIKTVFESVFQPIVNGIEGMIPRVIAGFIQFEIWVMKSLISVQRFQPVFTVLGAVAGFVFSMIGNYIGGIITIGSAWFAGIGQSISALQALGALGSSALQGLSAAALSVRQFLLGLSLSDIGLAMVKGLADGITGGAASVIAAITGVAGGAIAAAKKALDSHSPSKVFASIGMDTSEGMALGVDDGAANVQSSMEAMVSPPATGAAPAGGNASSAASSGTIYNIYVTSSGDGDDIAAKVRETIESIMAGAAAQMGNAVATVTA